MAIIDKLFRQMPAFRGKYRLANILLKHAIDREKNITITGKYNCRYTLPNLLENVSNEIFISGIYEKTTSDYLIKHIPVNGVFLDLGANIGAITIPLAKKRSDIKIACVEAAPWIYSVLADNLSQNGLDGIKTFNKALYFTDGEVLDFFSPREKFGKGSLSAVFTDQATKVSTITLDALVKGLDGPKIDFIKIDIEGYEYHAFQGGAALLGGKDAPDILFEFVDWAENNAAGIKAGSAQQLLLDYGYKIHYFRDGKTASALKDVIRTGSHLLLATKK